MVRKRWIVAAVGVLALVGIFGAGHWVLAQRPEESPPAAVTAEAPVTTPPPPSNPIVSVVVGNSETTYEQDPFESGRLRSSTTKVRQLFYIHADGVVESKQVN